MAKPAGSSYNSSTKHDRIRLPQERERDLAQLASWYLRGISRNQMAILLSEIRPYLVARTTVIRDIQEIHARWLKSQLIDFNTAQARELSRLDALIEEYWAAWDQSKLDGSEIVTEAVHDEQATSGQNPEKAGAQVGGDFQHSYTRDRTRTRIAGRDGTSKFLEGIERCIKLRCDILGLSASRSIVGVVDWRAKAKETGLESVASEQFEKLVSSFANALAAPTETEE